MIDNLDELRQIEGFPIGDDKDILSLSNPPFYTAFPSPYIEKFIHQLESPYDENNDDYHCEPFVSDISEGKNDPIYNAHSYHTKVPYKAIIPFIEHYTKPGDIIFDGFCGTGMTGIASRMVQRNAILCDLSPAATFIASNFNQPVDIKTLTVKAQQLIREIENECGWMYETNHLNGLKGIINFIIWSDVYKCPYCDKEIVFWEVAVDPISEKVKDEFICPGCKASLKKDQLKRCIVEEFDKALGQNTNKSVQIPVSINYSVGSKSYTKKPDKDDRNLIQRIQKMEIPYWYPTTRIDGDIDIWYERDYRQLGIYSVDSFYTKRNLWCISALWNRIQSCPDQRIKNALGFSVTASIYNLSKMNRWPRLRGPLAGTLYVPSINYEVNPILAVNRRFGRMEDIFAIINQKSGESIISTQSSTKLPSIPTNSVDYIFTDPPFGSNIIYSDLSIIWEAWLKVSTCTTKEIVVHRRKKRNAFSLDEYRELMMTAFAEMYRILKPNRWVTVEFHNSKANVWNAIQDALSRAGFVVAQVTVLDKQQGSFKQITSAGAVKNDLIINAYKPRLGFTKKLITEAGFGLEEEFTREHLSQLPLAANIERSKEMLYSKYLAYYVQHGYQVMYNGEQFYQALSKWGLEEKDGYWFSDETQANEYEKRKVKTFGKDGIQPQAILFVSDERSARHWIWNFLDQPKTYDEIYTDFLKVLQTSEDEIPEVKTILEESFACMENQWKRPDPLTQAELEKKRLERLLRQFEEYLTTASANQKLKEVRLEAVVAGFTECYRSGRYQDILTVGRKLNKSLLENSTDLYDFIDVAEAKVE
ncbi:MAG: DNA methylase [Chloroflexi bacterium HGW-Chloroflexi-10]|nr:MAG: DNA methylase [Chloroflexi bacterium HGW-Chloroflexi-10]